ncbi:hypothetical protein BDZ89DRAFT_25562 [Hymenopellis radicata]|nr:hypothetical protein BDZ89DRAFT_25562 [Hymenopellis radicata]
MSSPSLHLPSESDPKSQSPIPSSSSALGLTPSRYKTRRASSSHQSQISPPALTDGRTVSGSRERVSKHRATKSIPINIPSTPSSISIDRLPETPPRYREPSSPPSTPTPMSRSRGQLGHISSKSAALSSGHLPLSSSPPRPSISPRTGSPMRTRSPSTSRNRVVSPTTHRGLNSSSSSHLPITPPSPTPRRPSVDAGRRPSIDSPRHASLDASRGPSGREESPSPARPRPISPNQRAYAHNRHYNMSSASLTLTSNPEHREILRTATTLLCKEVVKPPVHAGRTEAGIRDWEEVEVRTRALARLERIWGKAGHPVAQVIYQMLEAFSSSGLSASGEERERRLFTEALRDGFVLCQLMNKLRASSVVRPDPREDGFVRTSNITKFLASCSSWGLANEDLFQRDDLIEATGESLARVAKTIIALVKFAEETPVDRSKFISGHAKRQSSTSSPYQGANSRAASSSPNLNAQSPSPQPSPARKRWSPPSGLPTVRSNSPGEAVVSKDGPSAQNRQVIGDHDRTDKGPTILAPPPKSPLRNRPPKQASDDADGHGLFTWAVKKVTPQRFPAPQSMDDASGRDSAADPFLRHSTASSAMTDTTTGTTGTMFSSLLDAGRASFNKFGTIRTVTTEATSESPSISRTEGSLIAEDLRKRTDSSGGKYDRKLSDAAVIDLSRVVEEAEDSGSSSRGHGHVGRTKSVRVEVDPERERERERLDRPALRLGKGKWPDDFLDVLQAHNHRPHPNRSSDDNADDRSPSPISASPPRKVAIVGASRRNESVESLPQFPRRPSHRARHSIDAPSVLLPRESSRRDISPDGLPGSRVMVRRHSTKPAQRNGAYVPRGSLDEPRGSDKEVMVPFPRTVSGEHTPAAVSSRSSSGDDPAPVTEHRPLRGRFQSDIEGTSRRRPRPNSYDEMGAKPARSRFESMVNLGTGNASASDLLARDAMDGSAVRKALIIREDGKPPTHFQLGNCIGRGQFGSVYRALNLNTGQMVAVKRIRLEGLKEDEVTTLMREVDLVKRLSHPSIVKYEGMARDENTLSIVLEYAENGSLGQTLKAFGKLNERLIASYVVKILEGLHYLHESDVVHCDLKAANILTTKTGNVKLSDFGVSLNMRAMEREIKDVAGTPNWMAPEVIELKGASPKSDIWSLACTVIELLTGRPPYGDIANSMTVMFRIVEDDMPPIPEGCSPLLEDFLRQCFNKDPTQRPSADLLCEHEWLKKNWGAHKELRPQDSIPFLRRVSADLQKSEAVRFLSQVDMPDTPAVSEHPDTPPSPRRRCNSSVPQGPMADNDISPREHTFVKTSFSKPMVCRVCLLSVKKSAVLCAQCSLISHSKCAVNAPPTCDLRAQLLLYAQYAEKGNPGSAYSNPADHLHPTSPMSDVAFVAHTHTPRSSIDAPPPQSPPPLASPPTAFKFIGAFKRSRSNLTPESDVGSLSTSPEKRCKGAVLSRRAAGKERAQSMSSTSTGANASLRSALTAAESTGRRSTISATETDTGTRVTFSPIEEGSVSRITSGSRRSERDDEAHFPGGLPEEPRRHRKAKSAGNNCAIQ